MSTKPVRRGSSGSEGDSQLVNDERKRKRMQSNRESARRSRMKKQQRLDELSTQVAQLQNQNSQIDVRVNLLTQNYMKIESENAVLRAQAKELAERLQNANSMLRIVEEVSGMSMDIEDIPDPLLKPWQLPCPAAQPIRAAGDMFMF